MERTFKTAWGKGTYYMTVIGIIMILPLIWICLIKILFLGIGFIAIMAFVLWFQYMVINNSKYLVANNEIIVKFFWTKPKKFLIDKIQRIEYVDLGTDWGRNSPSARFQLAIYFERKYLKSVEPRLFGPDNRDEFVEVLMQSNPNIIVDKDNRLFI